MVIPDLVATLTGEHDYGYDGGYEPDQDDDNNDAPMLSYEPEGAHILATAPSTLSAQGM